MSGTAVIAGVGPGFCESLAWKLAAEGYGVGLLARSADYLEGLAAELREAGHDALALPADITDADAVARAFDRARGELGPVTVLANSASAATTDAGGGIDADRLESAWRLYAQGPLRCLEAALPDMRAGGGTVLFFGAAPGMGDYAYRSAKGAARALARRLASDLGPEGIHVAHVVVSGPILNPDVYEAADDPADVDEAAYMDPDAVAETCMGLIGQDESAWTFELDLRPRVRPVRR